MEAVTWAASYRSNEETGDSLLLYEKRLRRLRRLGTALPHDLVSLKDLYSISYFPSFLIRVHRLIIFYPFIPLNAIPLTKYLCPMRNTSRTGIMTMTLAAMSR